ncbi:serine/threonine-protein kinase [Mycobacterium hubeiense]|uniref:serine/threonine-protein kinase n=1 Tax=Mycobacterium hubeiense TaxID=1867256 RepID=UPI000C7E9BB9|nr:serine/threonine-protein kinase [Mycobacterium sp. QGD 101]
MTSNEERIRAALPGYDVGQQIGKGGCGVVLSGMHLRLQRPVAIKQIPPQFADDAAVRRRFVTEAQLMAAIDHPHVVPVYDYIEQGDLCLLVMEYLPGGTVADRFANDGFDATSAMAVALACAAGLEAAHRHGVLHRDVKPSNLMFARGGTVKLTDFGIAKIVGGDDTLVTRAGEVVGTPSYIAPEQARGQQLSPATDVYALATMLYQLLSGVLPFPPGEDSMATLFMHAFEQPTPLTEAAPAVPEPIAEVVMRGLATDPTERFGTAESFGVALAEPAADCWGANWLAPVGIPVIGADTIVAAATGTSHPSKTTGTPRQTTTMRAVPPGLHTAPTRRVRPAQPMPRPRVELADVGRNDVAPVQKVVKFRSPRVPFVIAAVLGLIAIALALVGLGSPPRGGDLQPGTVTVAGLDPTTVDRVEVDMTKPIPVTVTGVPGDTAALALDVLGTSLGRHQAPFIPGAPGLTAEVPSPVNPYVLAGNVTAELRVLSGETPTATYRFGIRTTQPGLTTAVAVATVVLTLFAAAYVESYIRVLRRGRSRFSGSFGLPLSAAALAVAVVAAVWILLGREPTMATVIGCAAAAAAAGIAATIGAMRIGRKYRYRRSRRAWERARR